MTVIEYTSMSSNRLEKLLEEFKLEKSLLQNILSYYEKILSKKINIAQVDYYTMQRVYDYLHVTDVFGGNKKRINKSCY